MIIEAKKCLLILIIINNNSIFRIHILLKIKILNTFNKLLTQFSFRKYTNIYQKIISEKNYN